MARLSLATSVILLLLALGLGYVRYRVTSIKRQNLADQTEMELTRPGGQVWYKVVRRANHSDPVPTSTIEGFIRVGAGGFYAKDGRPGGPPPHRHFHEDEDFHVLSGTIGYILNGQVGTGGKGATVVMPVMSTHTYWNANPDKELRVTITLINRSGHPTVSEAFFETLAGLGQHYGDMERVNPLQVFLHAKAGAVEYMIYPVPVRLFIRYVICPLAELVGYKGLYPEYRSAVP